jgi:hypothetical protein
MYNMAIALVQQVIGDNFERRGNGEISRFGLCPEYPAMLHTADRITLAGDF